MYQVERQVADNYIQEQLRLTKRHSCKFLGEKEKKDTKGEGEKKEETTLQQCAIYVRNNQSGIS